MTDEKKEQLSCLSCNKKKLILLYLEPEGKGTKLLLACDSCGSLQSFKIGGSMKQEESKEYTKDKSKGASYLK